MVWQDWCQEHRGKQYQYFGKHTDGRPVSYSFNELGFRGPKFHTDPDVVVYGSSFSFGIGLEWEQSWHQQIARIKNIKVNCYAGAGFAVTNNDIVDLFQAYPPQNTSKVILQLREEEYTTAPYNLPPGIMAFKVDKEVKDKVVPTFLWRSFVDKAADGIHPGPRTHLNWAIILSKLWNL